MELEQNEAYGIEDLDEQEEWTDLEQQYAEYIRLQQLQEEEQQEIEQDEQEENEPEELDQSQIYSNDSNSNSGTSFPSTSGGSERQTKRKRELRSSLFGADLDEIAGTEELDSELGLGRLSNQRSQRRKKRRKGEGRGKNSKLSPEISRMIGEANMLYVSKEYSNAVKLLTDVIKKVPQIPDPYHTLGLIYEDMNDKVKSLEFFMIAAHLTPKNPSLWKRLGLMSREQGKLRQSIYCFTKAIRLDNRDFDAIWDRSMLYAEMGNNRKAVAGLLMILKFNPNDFSIGLEIAKIYHHGKQTEKAIKLLEDTLTSGKIYSQHPLQWNLLFAIVSMLTELHMNIGNYKLAVDSLLLHLSNILSHLNLRDQIDISADSEISASHCIESLEKQAISIPTDLYVNYGICLAHLGKVNLAQKYFNKLFDKEVSTLFIIGVEPNDEAGMQKMIGVQYFRIADTYMAIGEYKKAFEVYEKLSQISANVPTIDSHTIWMRQARCAYLLRDFTISLEFYKKVLQLDPTNSAATIDTVDIYMQTNRFEEALTQCNVYIEENKKIGKKEEEMEKRIILQKAMIHFEKNDCFQFLRVSLPILKLAATSYESLSYSITGKKRRRRRGRAITNGNENEGTTQAKRRRKKVVVDNSNDRSNLLNFGANEESAVPVDTINITTNDSNSRDAISDTNVPAEVNPQPEPQEKKNLPPALSLIEMLGEENVYKLFVQCCKAVAQVDRYDTEATSIIIRAINATKFEDKSKITKLKFLTVGISLNNEDYNSAYDGVRHICLQKPYNISLWCLFNKILTKTGTFVSHIKFIARLLAKNQDSIPLQLLVGHHYSMAGSHKLALKQYFTALETIPDDPLVNLCIGMCYLNQVMNRRLKDRHYTVMQAFTFLFKYHKLSNGSDEANYNIARAFHQIGILDLAIPFYQKVLSAPDTDGVESLKRETAYNLSLIYRECGSIELANNVLCQYLVI